ncbi:hypothetical protein A0H81_08270 [Grifola frondosa]|uniref:Uncharacterized protein n=1 Tax=Grifola frondosa TaxID=5627 RepID=A0A1C7M4W2_GRIFR|nr:hypothetical protein A0H81_08270 [Grifola frondosa]
MSACPQLQTSAPYPLSPSPAQSMYGDDASLPPQLRPTITRRETDHILSYYESDLAGRTYISPDTDADSPSLSLESSMFFPSDSDSSSANGYASARAPQSAELDLPPAAPSRHTRRSSVPSEGGADRRRLAIVEMDSTAPLSVARKRSGGLNESGNPTCSPISMGSLLSRRGVNVSGLALMAPPDASPRTYTDLTPPTTAPIIVSDRTAHLPHSAAHHRSASEAVEAAGKSRLHRKSSRDVGIVGVGSASSASDSLGPICECPSFRLQPVPSPTPGGTPELSDSSVYQSPQSPEYAYMETKAQLSRWEEVVTPGIGEYKDIQQPVVVPWL